MILIGWICKFKAEGLILPFCLYTEWSNNMSKKINKTNAMRILDKNNVLYSVHSYECDDFMDGVSIANTLNLPVEQTFKTLVLVGKSKENYVFVVPVAEELDLKKCASVAKEKSIELINVNDMLNLTGYIRGGCSPIGMKKQFQTFIHSSAKEYNTIFFSGGKRGIQIEVNPNDLCKVVSVEFCDIVFNIV